MVILLPALFFWYKNALRSWKPYVSMVALVGFQGFMGWWMVRSGLVDDPHVSHFRLAAHLATALVLYSLIFWESLVIWSALCNVGDGVIPEFSRRKYPESSPHKLLGSRYFAMQNSGMTRIVMRLTLLLLFIQIFLGALVAGLDAGMIYNTFPLMGNNFVPSEFELSWEMFYDPASVQFVHRCFAYLVGISALMLAYRIGGRLATMLVLAVFMQIFLGIFTVLYVVPMKLALAHQLFAILLLSLVIYIAFIMKQQQERKYA